MTKTGLVKFFREVRNEGRKVTWPSRKETTVSTISVFIMVTLAAIFLYLADQVMAFGVRIIMGL